MKYLFLISAATVLCALHSCQSVPGTAVASHPDSVSVIKPLYITDTVVNDTDDPAVWINHADPAGSLIIGTDKDSSGGLYVFDLKGKMIHEKVVKGLRRPNNVDVEYGLMLNGQPVDIAVTTERFTHK